MDGVVIEACWGVVWAFPRVTAVALGVPEDH